MKKKRCQTSTTKVLPLGCTLCRTRSVSRDRRRHILLCNAELSLLAQVAWIISIGTASATLGINVGHELIHKSDRLENWAGGILYACVCYAGFKVEHVRGHHVMYQRL